MLIVAGFVRLPAGQVPALLDAARAQADATRAEDGCLQYTYAEDVFEPGVIRVFELWRDQAALDAHFGAPHMKPWRAALAAAGVEERLLHAWDLAGEGRAV